MRALIRFLFALGAIVFGIATITWSFYVKFKYGMPWASYKGSHISPWPGMLVFISFIGILWALGDLWLHGGPKARRQAKLEAQRQAEQAQARARASSPVEASAASEAPCSTKQPGDAS